MMYSYPFIVKIRPVIAFLGAIYSIVKVCFGIFNVYPRDHFISYMLFYGGLMIGFIFWMYISWFFLHIYRYTEYDLEIIDPVLRKRKTINFEDIIAIRDFVVTGEVPSAIRAGHVLVTKDNNEIYLTESLPCWSDIAKHTNGIPNVKPPFFRCLI